jgi:NSS family neurotransmitter:Na+ symporter
MASNGNGNGNNNDNGAGRGHWGSRTGFILAAAGSAVGLGNIWKFPYITGENGGGWFVLIYLACIVLVGVPIMMAEIMIGRSAQKQPVGAFNKLQGGKSPWAAVGWMGLLAGFIILSFYIVVAGWAMDYTLKSVANFTDPIHAAAEVEAIEYRVRTPLEEMRETLSGRLADREASDPSRELRNSVRPSDWDGLSSYGVALAAGGEEAAQLLLAENSEMAAQVAAAEPVAAQIAEVEADALQEARDHYAGVSDTEVRDEAETVARRSAIFLRVQDVFMTMATDGWTATFWAILFMLVTILVVAQGVGKGIERACKVLMPMLFAVMLILVFYGMFTGGFGQAIDFVFRPDSTKLQASGVLEALGHAFFTLSLGMGAMITYGSYQKSKTGLAKQTLWIAGLDTGVALLACLMIFPITFAYGQDPAAGPGLVFMSMPLAFAEIGGVGILLGILFFGLLVVAALTSAISLLEVVVSYFIDERGWRRSRAVWFVGAAIFAFGVPSAFALDGDFLMSGWEPSFGMNFFDTMDYLASNWLLPLGGLFIAIYAGWVMPNKLRDAELEGMTPNMMKVWFGLIRFVAPALVILVLLQKVGILDINELF